MTLGVTVTCQPTASAPRAFIVRPVPISPSNAPSVFGMPQFAPSDDAGLGVDRHERHRAETMAALPGADQPEDLVYGHRVSS